MRTDGSGLVGQRVTEVRAMTEEEASAEGWGNSKDTVVLVFEDGTKVYPSCDDEGNGPGVMFGEDPKCGLIRIDAEK